MLNCQRCVAFVHPKQVFKTILKWRTNKFFKNFVAITVHLHLTKSIFQRIANSQPWVGQGSVEVEKDMGELGHKMSSKFQVSSSKSALK